MRRLLLLTVLLLGVARFAAAQSTTTTAAPTTTTVTTSTTTTTTLASLATCVTDLSATYINAPYMALGHCTFTASYTTGGMKITTANTIRDAGAKLCGSFARVPITVLFQPMLEGSTAAVFTYNNSKTNPRILCLSGTAECSGATDLSATPVRFHSDCR